MKGSSTLSISFCTKIFTQKGDDLVQDSRLSTSPENFQRLYDELSEPNKAIITAMMNMYFALFCSIQQVQDVSRKNRK